MKVLERAVTKVEDELLRRLRAAGIELAPDGRLPAGSRPLEQLRDALDESLSISLGGQLARCFALRDRPRRSGWATERWRTTRLRHEVDCSTIPGACRRQWFAAQPLRSLMTAVSWRSGRADL